MIRPSLRIIFTLLICFLSLNLYSEEKKSLAVLNLEGKNVPQNTASAVTEMVTTEIVNTGKFQVVERNQMRNILSEQGFQQTGCTDQACAVKIGKLLSAQKILMGSVSKIDKGLVINIRIVDVEKGIAEMAAMEKAESESMLPETAKKIARKITGKKGTIEEDESFTTRGYYLRGIVPGWGQLYSGHETKGYVFMASFVVSAALMIYGIIDFNTKRDEYMDLPRSASQSEFDSKNDDKKTAGLFALSMISITGLIYAANWADLIFFNSTPAQAKTAMAGSNKGDICFNAGSYNMSRYSGEIQYGASIGIKY